MQRETRSIPRDEKTEEEEEEEKKKRKKEMDDRARCSEGDPSAWEPVGRRQVYVYTGAATLNQFAGSRKEQRNQFISRHSCGASAHDISLEELTGYPRASPLLTSLARTSEASEFE